MNATPDTPRSVHIPTQCPECGKVVKYSFDFDEHGKPCPAYLCVAFGGSCGWKQLVKPAAPPDTPGGGIPEPDSNDILFAKDLEALLGKFPLDAHGQCLDATSAYVRSFIRLLAAERQRASLREIAGLLEGWDRRGGYVCWLKAKVVALEKKLDQERTYANDLDGSLQSIAMEVTGGPETAGLVCKIEELVKSRAAIEAETVERCAKIAEEWSIEYCNGRAIAAAIRALKPEEK